jgi:hypothetical protein
MSPVEAAVAEWAAGHPKIKRAWIVGELEVAVEIQPVGDSEETIAVWLAKGEQWRSQLRQRIDPTLELEWFDPDRDEPFLAEALGRDKTLVFERA